MMSINEQIGMPILRKGQSIYQPALYGNIGLDEITSLNEPRAVVVGTAYWQNAEGKNKDQADDWGLNSTWSGCNSCGGGFSSATGGDRTKFEICLGKCEVLHPFNRTKREICANECKAKHGITNIADYITAGQTPTVTQQIKDKLPDTLGGNKVTNTKNTNTAPTEDELTDPANIAGLSPNMKIGLAVGGIAVLGLIIFLVRRK